VGFKPSISTRPSPAARYMFVFVGMESACKTKAVSLGVRGHFPRFLQTRANSPVHGFLSPLAASIASMEAGERPEYSHWLYATMSGSNRRCSERKGFGIASRSSAAFCSRFLQGLEGA